MPLGKMKETLLALREYALGKGMKAHLSLHLEHSHLTRLANGSVSLNTTERVATLTVEAFGERRSAAATQVCGLTDLAAMRAAVDRAREMLQSASPLTFQPSLANIPHDSVHESAYDPALADISNEQILDYINTAAGDLEDEDITLGGSFSVGGTARVFLSTLSPCAVSWRLSDAQITLVLASARHKWEINAEQSAERFRDLDAAAMNRRLAFLKEQYTRRPATRLPLGPQLVVFGAAAAAEYLNYLSYLGLYGAAMKRGYGMYKEADIGKQLLSPLVTLTEGPGIRGAFALPADNFGRERKETDWFSQGRLKGFIWHQAAADEYAQNATGHDVAHESYALRAGDRAINTLEELAKMPRDRDILYVPYLHYTGMVSPSEGLITGTSRFGALLLKKDGSIEVPYNVRFTEKLSDIFGGKLRWLSNETQAYNLSNTYGSRNPEAVVVPRLMCCEGVKVEISNKGY